MEGLFPPDLTKPEKSLIVRKYGSPQTKNPYYPSVGPWCGHHRFVPQRNQNLRTAYLWGSSQSPRWFKKWEKSVRRAGASAKKHEITVKRVDWKHFVVPVEPPARLRLLEYSSTHQTPFIFHPQLVYFQKIGPDLFLHTYGFSEPLYSRMGKEKGRQTSDALSLPPYMSHKVNGQLSGRRVRLTAQRSGIST